MRNRLLSGVGVAVALGLVLVVLPALPASAKGLSQSQINNIEKNLHHGKNITFEATYLADSGGQKQTVTVAQAPPKSYFGASGSSVINDGKSTYFCSANANAGSSGSTGSTGNSGPTTTTSGSGKLQCVKESGVSPLLGLEDLFSSSTALTLLNEAKQSVAAHAAGVHLTASSGNYAGQSASCFGGTVRGQSGKYCVTSKGVLAYVTTGNGKNNYFELTKFSTKPPSGLFTLPAGATTESIPSGAVP
jgi:hypothetical protein